MEYTKKKIATQIMYISTIIQPADVVLLRSRAFSRSFCNVYL